jgi:hypothetical protein
MTGLKNGGSIPVEKINEQSPGFREQLLKAAESRMTGCRMVDAIQIAPPPPVEVALVPEAVPPPTVEVALVLEVDPEPKAALFPVEVDPEPEAAPPPTVEVGNKPEHRYPKRDRKQKLQDTDDKPAMQCHVSKSAKYVFGAAVRRNTDV